MAGLPDVRARLRRAIDRLHIAAYGHIRPQGGQARPSQRPRITQAFSFKERGIGFSGKLL